MSNSIPAPVIQRSHSQGFDRFEILIWAPLPKYAANRLGEFILGATALPTDRVEMNDYAVLGQIFLNHAMIGREPEYNGWQPIIAPVTSISLLQGMETTPFAGHGLVGTLSFEIFNALDPRASYLYFGTPVAFMDKYLQKILFRGTVASARLTPKKDGTYTVGVEAVDAISKLASIRKYQETSPQARDWPDVVSKLLDGFETQITSTRTAPKIGNIVKESTLTEYLDTIANSAGLYWHAAHDGHICFTDAFNQPATFALIGDNDIDTTLPKLNLTDVTANFDTSKFISIVTVENTLGVKNDAGEWQPETTHDRIENAQKIQQYGANNFRLETAAAGRRALIAQVKKTVNDMTPAQIISKATVAVDIDTENYQQIITRALAIKVGEKAITSFRSDDGEVKVASIEMAITPKTFEVAFDLF